MPPSDNVFARGVVGSQQDMHRGINPVVVVRLIDNVEALEAFRDWIGWIDDVYADMFFVLVS